MPNPNQLRIIFMGTPDFAVPSLAILKNNFEVIAVVTSPDKPSGRGLKIRESAVKHYAVEHGIPVLQPVKLKDPAFIDQLRALQADVQVVVAFRMLPEIVWNMPPLGTVNLHASLLPQYRGAAPINWAVINGEKETGITTFKLQHEIDTGEIIDRQVIPIGEDETAGELHDKLMTAGALLLLKTIQSMASGHYQSIPQGSIAGAGNIKHAPKIFKADCRIAWNRNMAHIHNFIRGLSPYPAAWTTLNGKTLKILRSQSISADNHPHAGQVETDYQNYFRIACKDGWIVPTEVQLEGKRSMETEEFLRGYREKEMVIA